MFYWRGEQMCLRKITVVSRHWRRRSKLQTYRISRNLFRRPSNSLQTRKSVCLVPIFCSTVYEIFRFVHDNANFIANSEYIFQTQTSSYNYKHPPSLSNNLTDVF